MTISKGTATNCSFTLGTSGASIPSCSGVSTTVTVSPTAGYGNPSVTQSGASAAPTISGSGNNWTVSYGNNTTGTSTIAVSCSANTYTVTLNDNTGSGGSGSKTVTYNANTNLTTSVAVPTKDHHDFAGYWTSTDAGITFGTKLVNADGSWVASAGGGSTYTDGSKNWKYAGNITLYAKWTEHDLINYRTVCCTKYDITLASSGSKTGGLFEVDPASACEGTDITLMATADDGYEFSAWTVTNDDDDDDDVTTTVLGSGNEDKDAIEFDMPAYNITIDATFTCTEPTISAQPSGASYTQGDDATALSVTASAGTGSLDYQWQSSSDNSSWDDIDKETSSTYTPSTTSTGTMYYRVVVTNHECSESVESDAATIVVSAPSVCATPTFSVAAGTYGSAQSVELSCKTDGATIRYTTNGDDPDGSSTAYSSAISVSVNTTIKAKAFKDGMTASSVASATYNIRCAAPTFSLDEDIYVGSQSLTMSSATTGATVRYTTDESTPTGSSTAYSSALTVSTSTTYKAKAYKDGMTESEESEVYIMIQCAEPTFNVSAGTYNANQSVSISTTYGTTIYYTLDGNTPTTKSSTYSSAITIDATKTLKAIAVKSGCEDSDVASATYTLKCATPTFSPVAGTYTGAQSVSMSCATTGSAIHYTTNGTDPTGSSATYSSAISVGTNQTVKAIATKSGWSDSDVASAAYTIKYNVAVASVDNVTISAATPSIAEGSSAVAAYGSTVSLSYSGVASGKTWGGWKVYKTGDESTTVTVTSNQFTMPAYNVTVSAFLYGVSDAIAWCDPAVEVTGDVHLTSYNGISVNSTSDASNLLTVASTDLGSATSIEIGYLDGNDDEVAKASSVFRLANGSTYALIDASSSTIDVSASRVFSSTNYSVQYTPNAYDQRDNYKLQLTFKRGDKVLKTETKAIYGRALPEEFVIASKYLGHWYALPNTMGTATQAVTPIMITVDNATTPTEASLAPTTTIYKGAARKRPSSNVNSIRLTNDGSHWLITNNSDAQLGLSATETEGYENREVWYLKSSDFNVYELAMDPAQSPSKKLGMYSGNMGMYADPAYTSEDIYLLPVNTKYTPVDVTDTDWMKDIIGVTASVSATKLGLAQEDGTETDPVTLSSSGTSHAADFDGDIDFTGLKDKTLWLKWYDGSTLVGGSQVTVPSIIEAGSNTSWSALETALGKSTTLDDIVVLSKPMTVGDAHAKAKQIVIDQSGDNTGKLTIQPSKGLEVAGTVKVYDGSAFGATTETDLVLESSSSEGNASLIFNNSNACQATVQQYSKAAIVGDTWNWQYVGTPFTGSIPGYNYYGSWMYKWDKTDGWLVVHGGDELTPFAGYCLTQESATTHVMGGTLVATDGNDQTITMEEETDMVLANSWTAPIWIGGFTAETFTSEPATIYLFNTGSAENGSSAGTTEAGTYNAVPVNTGPYVGTELIPSMQGFFVTTNGDGGKEGTIKLKYDELVRPDKYRTSITTGQMYAPRRAKAVENKPAVMKIMANGSKYSDRVVILERTDFSNGFDNGWDGEKLSFGAEAPSVYVINEQGGYDAVSAIPSFEGTVVGFRAGTNDSCTISFEFDGDETLYLNDLQAQQSTLIDAEQTYTFSTSGNDNEARFIISATPIQQMPTSIDNGGLMNDGMVKVRKIIINDKLFIIRGGRMYSAEGQMVK